MRIILHLGVHKTATTYLQTLLEANRERLRAESVGYVTLAEMRSGVTAAARRPGLFGMRLRRAVRPLLDRYNDCRLLILSDENLSGGSRELIDRSYYSEAGARAARLAKALRSDDVGIMVATRSYDSFVSSAYCEHLRNWPYLTPAEYLAAVDVDGLNWSSLIGDLCRRVGQEHVTVWRFEDLGEIEDELLSALTGGAAIDWIKPQGPVRRSLSQKAVDELAAQAQRLSREEVSALVEPVAEASPLGAAPFRAYDEQTAQALRARYDRDMEAVQGEFPRLHFLRPRRSANAS